MRQFEDCIHESNLIEVEYVGERFTWERNVLKERIDWGFTNNEWITSFPFTKVHHLSKFGSDHRPILLTSSLEKKKNYTPPPFRCQAAWLLEEDFTNVV